jgi:isoleucyl-tRNA synthetase
VADDSVAVSFLDGGGFVVLDTATTPELEAEGVARDVVRAVQQARRDADLDVSDRIALTLHAEPVAAAAIAAHEELIAGETLTTSLTVVPRTFGDDDTVVELGGDATIQVEVTKA